MTSKWVNFKALFKSTWDRLHFKIAVGTTAFTSAILLMVFAYFLIAARSSRMMEFVDRANEKSNIIYMSIKTAMAYKTPDTAHAVAEELVNQLQNSDEISHIAILDKEGNAWLTSYSSDDATMLTNNETTCFPCHQNKESMKMNASWIYTLDRDQQFYRIVTVFPNKADCMQCHDATSSINGLLIADFSMENLKSAYTNEFLLISAVLSVSLGAMLLSLRFLLKRQVLNRIKMLSERTRLVGQGNLNVQSTIKGNDELAWIERDFNEMCIGLVGQKKRNDELQKELIEREKFAVIGHLVTGIAHDFNTPLGIVLSRLECLKLERDEAPVPRELLKDLKVIERQILRISRTVQGLLSFSKQTPVNLENVKVNAVLHEAVSTCKPAFENRKIKLIHDNFCSPVSLYGSSIQLEQMIINVLNNALDASPDSGVVRLSAQLYTNKKVNYVILLIEDNGPGFTDDQVKRAFVPFVTTKESNKGTGLGLAIVAQIVSQHGGTIKIGKSEMGGAAIEIRLPTVENGSG